MSQSASADPFRPQDIRFILTSLMVTIFLSMLDQTIVAVAMPGIQADLGHFEILPWVISGYMLAFAVASPIVGKLSDIYGRRTLLLSTQILFAGASLICALAPTMAVLIFGRILQGAGGAGLVIVTQAIIGDIVTPRERGKYMAYISSMVALASASGPVLGGFMTAYLSWRSIFWINLPLAAAAFAASSTALSILPRVKSHRRIDYIGGGLLSLAISLVLLLMTRIGQGASLWQWDMIALVAGFAVAGFSCYVYERQVEDPILPVSFFSVPAITRGWIIAALVTAVYIGMTVLIPLQMKIAQGLNIQGAAIRLIPLTLAVPLGAFSVGQLMARTGTTKVARICGALAALFGILAYTVSDFDNAYITSLAMIPIGIGIGFLYPTVLVALQNEVSAQDIGVITASVQLYRTLGGALGVAALSALLLVLLGPGISALEGAKPGGATIAPVNLSPAQIADAFRILYGCIATAMGIVCVLTVGMEERKLRGPELLQNAEA